MLQQTKVPKQTVYMDIFIDVLSESEDDVEGVDRRVVHAISNIVYGDAFMTAMKEALAKLNYDYKLNLDYILTPE